MANVLVWKKKEERSAKSHRSSCLKFDDVMCNNKGGEN